MCIRDSDKRRICCDRNLSALHIDRNVQFKTLRDRLTSNLRGITSETRSMPKQSRRHDHHKESNLCASQVLSVDNEIFVSDIFHRRMAQIHKHEANDLLRKNASRFVFNKSSIIESAKAEFLLRVWSEAPTESPSTHRRIPSRAVFEGC